MLKKKITARIRAAVLRAARELCFTVIQNTKMLSWKKTRDLRDTRPWRKKKGKECHSPCKTAFDTLNGHRRNTEYSYPHWISVSDHSTRVVSLSTRWQETQKFSFSHLMWRENIFLIFQLIPFLWQNIKLHQTLDIQKQWPLKFWIISLSCTTSTFKELFFNDQIFGNLSLNHTCHTSTIHETAYEGAQDAHYVLKSQYNSCHTATWCLTTSHGYLSGMKKDYFEVLNNIEILWR